MRKLYMRVRDGMPGWLSRCEALLEKLESRTLVRCLIFLLVFALIAGTMFLLNSHTPLLMDDYDYMYSWATGEKLAGFEDVIRSQIVHYLTWGGRAVNHTCLQIMEYAGKGVFNVINTLMYLLLLLEIGYIAGAGRRAKGEWLQMILSHLILFTMVPFFGMVFLWMTGACNYLWGTVIALLPVAMLRAAREDRFLSESKAAGLLMAPVGFVAGWTNENTALGVIALVFASLALDWLEGRRAKKRLWVMLLAQCAGALAMLLAPGNGARMDTLAEGSLAIELVRRAANIVVYGASYMGLILAAALLLAFGLRGRNARIGYAALLLFGALVACAAMIGSPVLSDRTFTGAIVLSVAALSVLFCDLLETLPQLRAGALAALPFLLMVMVYTGYHAIGDVSRYEAQWNGRVGVIERAAEAGENEVKVSSLPSASRFTIDAQLCEDAGQWPNTTLEKHFGIRVIGE